MAEEILEWAPFTLRPGVGEEALLSASAELQADFIAQQEGFRGRRLVRAGDGRYVDLVWWSSRDAAERAMERARESKACARYFGVMAADCADAGAGVAHFTVVADYPD